VPLFSLSLPPLTFALLTLHFLEKTFVPYLLLELPSRLPFNFPNFFPGLWEGVILYRNTSPSSFFSAYFSVFPRFPVPLKEFDPRCGVKLTTGNFFFLFFRPP